MIPKVGFFVLFWEKYRHQNLLSRFTELQFLSCASFRCSSRNKLLICINSHDNNYARYSFISFFSRQQYMVLPKKIFFLLIVHGTYNFAILKCLVESFTQQQITLSLGTLKELFNLQEASLPYTCTAMTGTSTHWFLCCGCFHCFLGNRICSIYFSDFRVI